MEIGIEVSLYLWKICLSLYYRGGSDVSAIEILTSLTVIASTDTGNRHCRGGVIPQVLLQLLWCATMPPGFSTDGVYEKLFQLLRDLHAIVQIDCTGIGLVSGKATVHSAELGASDFPILDSTPNS